MTETLSESVEVLEANDDRWTEVKAVSLGGSTQSSQTQSSQDAAEVSKNQEPEHGHGLRTGEDARNAAPPNGEHGEEEAWWLNEAAAPAKPKDPEPVPDKESM